MNNQAFSKIWIIVIILVLVAGGFFAWQYLKVPKEEGKVPGGQGEYPSWVKDLITQEEGGPVANPPASLTRCEYKNQIVYYLPPRCCDIPSVLYDESGNVICAPDGGFTGRGDERCSDFFTERKNCEVIWEDSRSQPTEVKKETETPKVAQEETTGENTYKNEEYGFEMIYPSYFFSGGLPQTMAMDCDYANFSTKCPVVPPITEDTLARGFAEVERKTINDIPYCLQTHSEGAAGTTYITYDYVAVRNEKCFVVSFSVGYPNCENYLPVSNQQDQEAYDKCKLKNTLTKPETIDQIISTFRFLE